MYEALKHFLSIPVPLALFALCIGTLWWDVNLLRRWAERENKKRIAEIKAILPS
jgi:hypothetical protein